MAFLFAAFCLLFSFASATDDFAKYASMTSRGSLHDLPRNATGGAVNVKLRIETLDIIDVNERTGEVDMMVLAYLEWRLEAGRVGDTKKMKLSPDELWTPDITVYEQTRPGTLISPPEITMASGGLIVMVPSCRLTVRCNVTSEPASAVLGGSCALTLGSWVYSGGELNLTSDQTNLGGLGFYKENTARYEITSNSVERKVEQYACCPEEYPTVHVNFTFRRKS